MIVWGNEAGNYQKRDVTQDDVQRITLDGLRESGLDSDKCLVKGQPGNVGARFDGRCAAESDLLYQDDSFTFNHRFIALISAHCFQRQDWLVRTNGGYGYARGDRVARKDRRDES